MGKTISVYIDDDLLVRMKIPCDKTAGYLRYKDVLFSSYSLAVHINIFILRLFGNAINTINAINSINTINAINPINAKNAINAMNAMNAINPTNAINAINATNAIILNKNVHIEN